MRTFVFLALPSWFSVKHIRQSDNRISHSFEDKLQWILHNKVLFIYMSNTSFCNENSHVLSVREEFIFKRFLHRVCSSKY